MEARMMDTIERFVKAQESDYACALQEIKNGRKRSHWMWYVFPQFKGLGFSETSKYYSIKNVDEAKSYLNHPILGERLKLITKELLALNENNANKVFGSPDDLKLKSSMTLFAAIDESQEHIFQAELDKFFNGQTYNKTLTLKEEYICQI